MFVKLKIQFTDHTDSVFFVERFMIGHKCFLTQKFIRLQENQEKKYLESFWGFCELEFVDRFQCAMSGLSLVLCSSDESVHGSYVGFHHYVRLRASADSVSLMLSVFPDASLACVHGLWNQIDEVIPPYT